MIMTPDEPAASPSQRRDFRIMLVVWGVVILGCCVAPVRNYLHSGTWTKDYDIWFNTGQLVLNHGQIYPTEQGVEFTFMYPPPAATLLAPLTTLGKLPYILFLETLNSFAWGISALLCVYLVAGRQAWAKTSLLLFILPAVFCISYIWDTYLIGQPNLVLLAMLLGAFVCLRHQLQWGAGLLVALAAAIKAFPIMALVYFLYRRQWKAALATVLFLAFMLLLMPVPMRGWNQNLTDLKTWSQGMLGTYNAGAIAQRSDSAFRWKNQSLIASANRLLRHVPADSRHVKVNGQIVEEQIYSNVANLDFRTINIVIVLAGLALCLGYVAVMPPQRLRTPRTDTIEMAMLLVLMIVFSPLSWFYYGVWLMLAFTVVLGFIIDAPPGSPERKTAIIWLVVCLVFFNFVLPFNWIRPIRATGITFFGDLLLLGELTWMLLRDRRHEAAGE